MDMITQPVDILEGVVTDRTGVVVERDVLAHTGCRTELRIAGGACV
jgi:hypothetical protein